VAEAIIKQRSPYASCVKTLTFDNGLEFSRHENIADALSCKTYFARPYCSSDRATNENTNGLICQYLPKKSFFADIGEMRTQMIQYRLNNRPRKCLDYETPAEVFFRSENLRRVALGT
jgi:IS30 family transposase